VNELEELFDFWRQCSGHGRSRLDDRRARDLRRALRWGYSVADIRLAILGCCTNPWYGGGQNDRRTVYNHLGLILRDADHIDRFVKDGEQEVARCWTRALEEAERRIPKQSMPQAVREKIAGIWTGSRRLR
jgi:hypothetical protein